MYVCINIYMYVCMTHIHGLCRFMTDRQRELSRTVVPLIQTTMTPGYEKGSAEFGTGSARRR